MRRRPTLFRERDLARAIRVATKEGLNIGRIAIDTTGRIEIVTAIAKGGELASSAKEGNEWDGVES
jgi:hypothetical protein